MGRMGRMGRIGRMDGMDGWTGGRLGGEGSCLRGAGPAVWLRESGSRLQQSKVFGWLVRRGALGGVLAGALGAQGQL